MASTLTDLLSRRLVVVTGKGGVGKTTVAAALGVAAARAGHRAVIVEVGSRKGALALFGNGDSADARRPDTEERELANGLFHRSVDPESALATYLDDQFGGLGLGQILTSTSMFGVLTAATPGLRELLTIGTVWELTQPERRTAGADPYDVVILDAPATGHGIGLLQAPATFARAAGDGPVARQGTIIATTLADPQQTAVVAVTRAEALPVGETIDLAGAVEETLGFAPLAVVANRLTPDRFADHEASTLAAASHPALGVAREAHELARRQREQLARLEQALPISVWPVGEQPGMRDLAAIADELPSLP